MIRTVLRWLLGLFYFTAGILHLALPAPFLKIVPGWVPLPATVIMLTGMAEIAGAAALLQGRWPALRRLAGACLALYALCVWPANVNHMLIDLARTDGHGLPLAYHIPRLLAQPLLIWAALWSAGTVDWPFRPSPAPPE